jgi:hypothetical protein
MLIMFRPMLVALFLALSVKFAGAATVNVAGRSLVLDPPQGYCQTDKNKAERPIVESLEKGAGPGTIVLMVFARCDELESLRIGKMKNLQHYGQYMAVPVGGPRVTPQPAGVIRADFIANIAASIESPAQKMPDQYPDLAAGQSKSIGLLDKDPNAAYVAALQGFKAPSGDTLKIASVAAITLINGIVVNTDLFEVYTMAPAFEDLLKQQKTNMKTVVAKNL